MSIAILGLSHKTADIQIRERLAISEGSLLRALADFRTHIPHADIVIMSTCNRLEIYTSYTHSEVLQHWLACFHALPPESLSNYLYYYEGLDALRHAMKVASSLDSMVLGEPQIFGQMKKAFTLSANHGYVSHHLERAFQYIFSAAKAVRSHTKIGHCPVSVAYHAAYMAKENVHFSESQHVLVIGAGGTSALLTQHIRSMGCKHITILNRSLEKAEALARHFQVQAAPLEALHAYLNSADLILSATESTDYVITHKMARLAAEQRIKDTPMLYIDVANPRDIDPAVAGIPNVWLYNLDDLHGKIEKSTERRKSTIQYAEKIIHEHQERYSRATRERLSTSTIKNIRTKAESLKNKELHHSLKLLEQGKAPEEVLLLLANRLTQKWLHQPCVNLREASVKGEDHILDAAKALFDEKTEI